MKGKMPPGVIGNVMKKKRAMEGKLPADNDKDDMPITPEFQGFKARMRLDRPGRKFGGRVGADRSPLSSAGKRCD